MSQSNCVQPTPSIKGEKGFSQQIFGISSELLIALQLEAKYDQ